MVLRRIGNKSKLAPLIQSYFPAHICYIEMFFGAGGMFFNKAPVAKYNILNDIDNDIYNLYSILLDKEKSLELYDTLDLIPYHESFWKEFKVTEYDGVMKAVKFLWLSNFGYMGKPDTLKFENGNSKQILLNNLKITQLFLNKYNIKFMNTDFRNIIDRVRFRDDKDKDKDNIFIYADPPYLGTENNYKDSFQKNDFIDLVEILKTSEKKFAISEFDNPIVKDICKDLNIIPIKERRTLNSRNTEILITNYEVNNLFN